METQEVIHKVIELSEQQGIAPDEVNEKEWLERALRDIPAFIKTFEEGLKQGLYDDLLKEYGYERQNNE